MLQYTMDKKKLHQNSKVSSSSKTFVFSTADVDRDGDRVIQSWDLSDFKKNPIALAFHDHTKPIGRWVNIKVVGGKLQGDLELAEVGTSDFINSLHKLIDQNILKSVSVGFRSQKAKENDFGGYDLSENYLFECSLVSVPANQNALRKEFSYLSEDQLKQICTVNGECSNKKSNDDGSDNKKTKHIKKGFKVKTLKERIEAAQKALLAKQDELDTLNQQEDLTDDDITKMGTLTTDISAIDGRIKQFEAMEKAAGGDIVKTDDKKKEKTFTKDEAKALFFKGMVTAVIASHKGISQAAAAATYYKDVKGVLDVTKAATAAATTGEAEWAGNLVQQGYGAFLETLYPATIYGQVQGMRFDFDNNRSIIVPMRKAGQDVSGGFIAEGAPIPVKADAFVTLELKPKKLGVISVFTAEILRSSTPNVEMLVREDITEDTAKAIDTAFLDDTAATDIRPAGLQDPTATGAGNINASVGGTVDNIATDVDGAMARMNAVELGQSGVIVMHPDRKRSLNRKTNALGQYPYRDNGLAEGFNIITSTNVPSDVVYFIDGRGMSFGSDIAPQFEISTQATIVMENPATEVDAGTSVSSMFQTNKTALRFLLGMDWKITRLGGVQVLTGVAW